MFEKFLILFASKLVGGAPLKILKHFSQVCQTFLNLAVGEKNRILICLTNKFRGIAQLYFLIGLIEQSYCKTEIL